MKRFLIAALALLFSHVVFAQGLPFPGPGLGPFSTSPRSTFITSTSQGACTTCTFTSVNIGTAASDRIVVAGLSARVGGVTEAITSVTIAGVTATAIAQCKDSVTNSTISSLHGALVTAGTTGNIVIVYTVGTVDVDLGVWTLNNTGGVVTPFSTMTNCVNANPMAGTLTSNPGGAAIGMIGTGGAIAFTWSGLVKDFGVNPSNAYSGASLSPTPGASVSVSVSGAGTESALATASW